MKDFLQKYLCFHLNKKHQQNYVQTQEEFHYPYYSKNLSK